MAEKKDFLRDDKLIEHIDIKKHNVVPMVDDMGKMAFQARNLHRASQIFNMMMESACLEVVKSWVARGFEFASDGCSFITHAVWAGNLY